MTGPGNGKDFIKVSTGVYHLDQGVSLRTIANLIREYQRTFRAPLVVDCEVTDDRQRDEYLQVLLSHGVEESWFTYSVRRIDRTGRGADLPSATPTIPPGELGPCHEMDKLSIFLGGKVRPCCGANYFNEGIVLYGDSRRDGLRDLTLRMCNSPLLQFLAKNPIAEIGRFVKRSPDSGGYSGICHFCEHAVGKLSKVEVARLQDALFAEADLFPGHELEIAP
jgi:hypothetical protein